MQDTFVVVEVFIETVKSIFLLHKWLFNLKYKGISHIPTYFWSENVVTSGIGFRIFSSVCAHYNPRSNSVNTAQTRKLKYQMFANVFSSTREISTPMFSVSAPNTFFMYVGRPQHFFQKRGIHFRQQDNVSLLAK